MSKCIEIFFDPQVEYCVQGLRIALEKRKFVVTPLLQLLLWDCPSYAMIIKMVCGCEEFSCCIKSQVLKKLCSSISSVHLKTRLLQ